jgi:hypothetical protein
VVGITIPAWIDFSEKTDQIRIATTMTGGQKVLSIVASNAP